jgi:hypothetical protein
MPPSGEGLPQAGVEGERRRGIAWVGRMRRCGRRSWMQAAADGVGVAEPFFGLAAVDGEGITGVRCVGPSDWSRMGRKGSPTGPN